MLLEICWHLLVQIRWRYGIWHQEVEFRSKNECSDLSIVWSMNVLVTKFSCSLLMIPIATDIVSSVEFFIGAKADYIPCRANFSPFFNLSPLIVFWKFEPLYYYSIFKHKTVFKNFSVPFKFSTILQKKLIVLVILYQITSNYFT